MSSKGAYIGPAEIPNLGAVQGNPQVKVVSGTSTTFTAASGAGTIAGGAGDFLGVSVGDVVQVVGASNAGNNGVHTVTAIDTPGTTITTSSTLVNETSSSVVITALP